MTEEGLYSRCETFIFLIKRPDRLVHFIWRYIAYVLAFGVDPVLRFTWWLWRDRNGTQPTIFAVIAMRRTGSTFLCDSLDAHPDIICHSELYNVNEVHPSEHTELPDYLKGILLRDIAPVFYLERIRDHASRVGVHAVGFKIFMDHQRHVLRYLCRKPDIPVILLSRENELRQYVSWRLAKQTKVYHSFDGTYKPAPVTIDPSHMWQWIVRRRRFMDHIKKRLEQRGGPLHSVTYEALISDVSVLNEIQSFIEVTPRSLRSDTMQKMNTAPLDELIQNADEITKAVEGTWLERSLERNEVVQ